MIASGGFSREDGATEHFCSRALLVSSSFQFLLCSHAITLQLQVFMTTCCQISVPNQTKIHSIWPSVDKGMARLNQHKWFFTECLVPPFYDVFIQCEFGFAQMLSMAQLARSYSSLIRAAEDSIQESMPFGNVLANSSWLTVKTELINVERRCSWPALWSFLLI